MMYGPDKGFMQLWISADLEGIFPEVRHEMRLSRFNMMQAFDRRLIGHDVMTMPLRISMCFRDPMKYACFGSLREKLCEIKVPEMYRKGDFVHHKIKRYSDVLKYREEVVSYLKNDMQGLFIWIACMHKRLGGITTIDGKDGEEPMEMFGYMTISAMNEAYVMQACKKMFGKSFGMLCPKEDIEQKSSSSRKKKKKKNGKRVRKMDGGAAFVDDMAAGSDEEEEEEEEEENEEDNIACEYVKETVVDTPSLKRYINESKRGAKCEAFRSQVEMHPDLVELMPRKDPDDWVMLIAGMDPKGTLLTLLNDYLNTVVDVHVGDIVKHVLCRLGKVKCFDECKHLGQDLWEEYNSEPSLYTFVDLIYTHPHYDCCHWVNFFCEAFRMYYPDGLRAVRKFVRHCTVCTYLKQEFEKKIQDMDLEKDDMVTSVDMNSQYPSCMYLLRFFSKWCEWIYCGCYRGAEVVKLHRHQSISPVYN